MDDGEVEPTNTDRVLACILDCIQRLGRPPTIREIADKTGISSTSVVNHHLNKLKRHGLIRREEDVARGIRIEGTRLVTPGQRVRVSLAEAFELEDGTRLPAGTVVVGELVAA